MVEVLRLSAEMIPSLRGIKFTSPGIDEYQRCLGQCTREQQILFGMDEMMLSALGVGATCMIGSTYNFMPGLYHAIIDNFNKGDQGKAKELQYEAVQVIDAFLKFSSLPAQKLIMRMVGMDCGPVRLPLQDLTPKEQQALEAALSKHDLMRWVAGKERITAL